MGLLLLDADAGRCRRGRGREALASASLESESFVVGGEEEVLFRRFLRASFASYSVSVPSSFLFSRLGDRACVGVLSMSRSELLFASSSLCDSDEASLAATGALPLPAICLPGLMITRLLLPEKLPVFGRRTDSRPFFRLPSGRRAGVRSSSFSSSSSDVSDESLCSSLSLA